MYEQLAKASAPNWGVEKTARPTDSFMKRRKRNASNPCLDGLAIHQEDHTCTSDSEL